MIFVIEVDNEGFKVFNASGTAIDPATQATVAAIQAALEAIRDTAGIKKITDALPTGDNWIGRIKLGDGTNLIAIATDATDLASGHGLAVLGRDAEDKARFLLTEDDGTLRVASQPPSPPPGTTEFVLAQDEADLVVGPSPSFEEEESAAIGNGLNLYLQTFTAGAAGDPSEKGSKVELYWREGGGPTDHLIARIYLTGQTVLETLPDVNKARDGTQLTGDGSTTKLVLRRERISTSAAEIDGEVRGYYV
jgi:hypothetical protein